MTVVLCFLVVLNVVGVTHTKVVLLRYFLKLHSPNLSIADGTPYVKNKFVWECKVPEGFV